MTIGHIPMEECNEKREVVLKHLSLSRQNTISKDFDMGHNPLTITRCVQFGHRSIRDCSCDAEADRK